METYFGHVCEKPKPDYAEQNKCIEEIDYANFTSQLNEKLLNISN